MRTLFEPVLNNLYTVAQCCILFFDQNGDLVYKQVPRKGEDVELTQPHLLEETKVYLKHSGRTLSISKSTLLGGCSFPDHSLLIVGPLAEPNEQLFRSINAMLNNIAWFVQRYIQVPSRLLEPELGRSYLDDLKEIEHILPDWSEVVMEDTSHHSYASELLPLDAVSQGDVQGYLLGQKQFKEGQGRNGTLAYSLLRHRQNLAVCHIVLCSRAAITGGLSVEQALTMADFLILAVERCKTGTDADLINDKAGLIFSRMVHDVQLKYPIRPKPMHVLTLKAMDLVKRYVYQKIDRKTLARELKVQADYLDRRLKGDINLTLMGCLADARLTEAANLLRHSDTPICEIASLLLFANSSHFSRNFKRKYGVSPSEFRNQHFGKISKD